MNINQMFESKFLRTTDLNGRRFNLLIRAIQVEDVGQEGKPEPKPIMYFSNQNGQPLKKGLVVNKTIAMEIANAYGPETDGWIGKSVELYPSMTMMKGVQTPCMRLRPLFEQGVGLPGQPASQPPPPLRRPAPEILGPGEAAAVSQAPFNDPLEHEAFGDSHEPPF